MYVNLGSRNITIDDTNFGSWCNVEGSGDEVPSDGGAWKEFYKKRNNGNWPRNCCVYGCREKATVGAHVRRLDGIQWSEEYIAPMCYRDNHHENDDPMILKPGTVLVPTK